MAACKAKIDSFYHGSAVDGEGLRSVIFFSGCNLCCGFCHNPETLYTDGNEYSLDEVVKRIMRYANYYRRGGVTLSGGEPFLQAEFCTALCDELAVNGVSVIAETNGLITDEQLIKRLSGVRLDIKNQGGESLEMLQSRYAAFLSACEKYLVPVTLTNVLVPTVNDTKYNATSLRILKNEYAVCREIKILPFHKMCVEKYGRIGKSFPFERYDEPSKEQIEEFYALINE